MTKNKLIQALEAIRDYQFPAHRIASHYDLIEVQKIAEEAIAADRESRQVANKDDIPNVFLDSEEKVSDWCDKQVANKAEVEPVAYLKFWARQSWSGNGNHDVEHAEGLEVCEAGEIGDDGEPAFPVYAAPPANKAEVDLSSIQRVEFTPYGMVPNPNGLYVNINEVQAVIAAPPATTGASTAPHEIAKALGLYEPVSMLCAVKAIESLRTPVGASTVLTDEQISEIASAVPCKFWHAEWFTLFARAIEREVAAQAGQVALPEWQPIETASKTGRTLLLGCFNEMGNWRTMRGQWFTKAEIDQDWEETDGFEAGWYETAVEPDFPNCWEISPTHWMELPAAPSPAKEPS